jgi:hypothetical protein
LILLMHISEKLSFHTVWRVVRPGSTIELQQGRRWVSAPRAL